MPNYVITNSTVFAGTAPIAVTATYQTQLLVGPTSAALNNPAYPGLRRGKIYDLLVGTAGTPADFSYEWEVTRTTAMGSTNTTAPAGSLSSVSSAFALDIADVGFSAYALNNSSAETNMPAGAQVWYVGINQRASYRWVAAPGSELVWPAVSSQGMALKTRSVSGGTATATGSIYFSE
jgi:hypothetical protein